MASIIFDSALEDEARGNIDFDTDSFKCMLCTSAFTPAKKTQLKRSDITNEVAASGGYVAGGFAAAITLTKDTVNDRLDIGLGGISIPSATITAHYAVYYKARGGAASADELVACIDLGADIVSTGGTWALSASTYRKQN